MLDDLLRQALALGKQGDARDFQMLVLRAYGVTTEAREYINDNTGVRWEDDQRVRGWYWDDIAVIPVQCEGTLHESNHAWYTNYMLSHPKEMLALDLQIAMYAQLEADKAAQLNVEPEFLDFMRGYYNGIGTWLGMFDHDGAGPEPKTTYERLLAAWKGVDSEIVQAVANVITWENIGGMASWTMGQTTAGPRRLPYGMRYLFDNFFTGEVKATPYYLEGGVP